MYSIFKSLILALCTLSFGLSISSMDNKTEGKYERFLLFTINQNRPGQLKVIETLLQKDLSLDYADPTSGITPLRAAIANKNLEAAKLLIEAGATVQTPSDQLSPLGTVAALGYSKFIPLLLQYGAQVNRPDKTGCTPFAIAAEQEHIECTRQLLQAGGDTSILRPDGQTILGFSAMHNHSSIVKALLENTDLNIVDADELTPLQRTVANGLVSMTKLLLDNGADIHKTNARGSTPAHMAAFHGRTKMLIFLLQYEPSLLNAQDYIGRTPLFWALQQKKLDAVGYLIQNGANPNSTLLTGQTLYAWAKENNIANAKQLNRLLYPIKKKKNSKKVKNKKKKTKSSLTFVQRQEKKEKRKTFTQSAPSTLYTAPLKKQPTTAERTEKLNALLTGTTDGSYVIEDDGKTISFGYKHLEGKATDRIYRLYRDRAPVGLQLAYHSRVIEKRNNFQDRDDSSDIVLHTFPESLDRMQGHCISGKFTDTEGRQITNRMFIGKKLIGNLWVEGLYILGFANIKGKLTCYHSFFKKKPFSDIMQNISITVSDKDKALLANVLDNIVKEFTI